MHPIHRGISTRGAFIYKDVFEARAKWRRIGLELGLTAGTLDGSHSITEDQLERVLLEWLNTGSATRQQLIDALFSAPVGESRLSGELERKYYG